LAQIVARFFPQRINEESITLAAHDSQSSGWTTATKSSLDTLSRMGVYPLGSIRKEGASMVCKGCHSVQLREYPAEINIQFAGKENLERPSVWVFPKLLVCLSCGFAEFRIPDTELQSLCINVTG
jgi:hypothetical protein